MVDHSSAQPAIKPEWKILVIDDDEEDFMIARDMLKAAKGRKFDVHWASTYTAGKNELLSDHYNAVLVDYDLGVHSGIEIIREANERGYAAPLILFTGRGNYEVDVEAMEAGATLYLTKSEANPLLLERAIRYAVELKHKELTLRQSEAQLRASEAALRQSEAKEREKLAELKAVLDATPAIVWITHDPKAEEVVGNQAAHDFLRVSPGKNLSKSAPVDAPRNFQVYQNGRELTPEELPLQITAATGRSIRDFEEEIVFDDGDRASLLGNVTPLLDDDGKPCGAVAAFINITERKQAEEALKERTEASRVSERKFSTLFQKAAYAAILGSLPDSTVVDVNEAWEKLYGYTREEAIGKTIPELNLVVNPELRPRYLAELMQNGFVHDYELQIRVKTGEVLTMRVNFDLLEIGGQQYTLNTSYDITPFKQAEAALRQSEEKYAKSFRSSPAAIAISTLAEGRFTEVNDRFTEIFDYAREEMVGHTSVELGLFADPAERNEILRLLQVEGRFRDYEVRMRNRNGELRDLLFSGEQVEIDGQYYLLALMIDMTERKRAEAALQSEQAKLKTVVENLEIGVMIGEPDGSRISVNPTTLRLFDLPATLQIVSQPSQFFQSYEIRSLDGRPLQTEERPAVRAMRGDYFSNLELQVHNLQTGRQWIASWSSVPIQNSQNELQLLVVTVQDITERKQAEQAILERESRLREFIENTHDTYFALDREWRFTYANHQFGELMGVDPQSVLGKNYWELFPQYLGTDIEQKYRQVITERVPLHFRRRGVYTHILYETSLYPTQEGLAVFSIDRTEEQRYQQQLENERARLEAVLEALPVGVWMTDAEGRIVGKNAQSDRIWAGDAPMVAGVDQYREYHSWDARTGQELKAEDFPLTKALRTGQPVAPEEHRILRFDGSEGFVLVSAVPIQDREDQLAGAVAINVDITESKQAEQALKQAEEKFSKAFLYNPVALAITRIADGRYLEVNEAFYRLTGYTPAEIIGRTVYDIALYAEPGKRIEMINWVKLEGGLRDYEIAIRTKSRAVRTILTSIDPIEIAGETWLLTTFIDITERNKTEQALRESGSALRKSEAMLRDFLENSQESFFILDRDWHFQYINRTFAEILHTSLDALAGKTFWEAFPNYVGTPVEQNYRQVMEERVPVRFEMGGVYSPNWFDLSVYPTQEGIGIFAINRSEERKTQEALLESQARLKRAQQIAHLGSWELDLTTNRLTWSDEVYRIFGVHPQAFAATFEAFLEHVHPDDRTAVDQTYANSIQQNLDGYEMEHRVIQAYTGEVRFVHEKCEHLRDANGQIIRSVGMIHDITERKQAEIDLQERNEALRASEAVLEAFFANSPGILNIEDENFHYLKTDPMTPTYFGLDRHSIVGKAVRELAPEFIENFGPMMRRVIETGQAETREVYSPVPGRPGEMTYWQSSYFPVPLPGGKRGIGIMGVEITGQKKTEQALELERAKLAAAIEEIPVGVCIGDAQGNVLSLNSAGLVLHDFSSEAEMFSRVENYLQEFELRFLDGSPMPLEEWPSSKALRGDFVQNQEVILHHLRTEKDRIVAYSAAPVKNNDGETLLIVYTLQDLTERKEAEVSLQHYAQELERSNQALQEFAFIASHDLQEPLRKIVMFGNNLRRQLCDAEDETAQDYLGRMQSAAERMQAMIQGLLELSRINTRGENFTPNNLNELVADVISDLEARIQAVNGRIEIGELPSIEADELQMRQLFQNLIGNALKFHKPDVPPVVRISGLIHKKSNLPMTEIRVADNGIGFEQEYAERIFQPFQRLHGRSEYEGTGLGLAICKKIVERHQGTIEVRSKPGEGTTFIVRLPTKPASS